MRLWSRTVTSEGLVSVMVGPASLCQLAAALDPQAGHVLLSAHAPLVGHDWTELPLPLAANAIPGPIRVAHLRYDALFDTREFLRGVDELDGYGADVRQFNSLPRSDVSFDDPRPQVRIARYRAFGLRVRIDLPHRNEVANVVTLDEASMNDVLARLGIT